MLRFWSFVVLLTFTLIGYSQSTLRIISPASIAGDIAITKGLLGNGFVDTIKGELVFANNGAGSSLACDTIMNNVSGKIVVIDRGTCTFLEKAQKAQRAGAKALILCNNVTSPARFIFGLPDPSVTIPCVMISKADCDRIRSAANGAQAFLYFADPSAGAPVLYSETFDGGKGAWTTKGISAPRDTFFWHPKGISNGALSGFRIDAPTADNGAMVFDADFLTTDGDTLKIPNGPPPYPNHEGELISPIINCSTFNSVTLKFFELFAGLNGSSSIAYSIDGGTTWSNPIAVNEDVLPNQATPGGKFIKMELPQLANKAQARIKFTFDGDFYAWIIDDVQLLGRASVDLVVTENFFMPFNYATPSSQITTDTSSFWEEITNLGSVSVGNAVAKVQVLDASNKVLHRDSVIIANIVGNNSDSLVINFPKSYIPGKLAQGLYKIVYSIVNPAGIDDGNITDNKREISFVITDNLYSKHDGTQNSRGYQWQSNFQWANLYLTSTDWNANDKFTATSAGFGTFSIGGDVMAGKSVTLYLARFKDNILSDLSNWDLTKGITANPSLEIVGTATYDFKNQNSERAEVTLQEIQNFNDGVPLKKGSKYLVVVSYADAANKFLNYNELDYFYDFGSFLFLDNEWSLFPYAPEISMRISLATPVDQITLPEYTLQLMPNPATDFIRANVNFEKATNVNFVIADIHGRVLQFESKKNVLKESFDFKTTSLAPGTYLMRISTDEGTKTKKFIIQR
ncbi:MAG: T9SS type A sorting domain-containing protein [Saprospiraceae bacterium]|nr:T9SS type A sorting domain-containing protein [Saprospiraceae bacterium]MBK6816144.1 T9SS type A sorting domain-containing protein [Saprospiraceae bacterium]MBP7800507.1 T9SS type A sorting domain-containing protein [Saprospiraceae bacterium]MBP8096406.1 T9SS type A sorting domain-containing protein [Saprospiraceae bacterium]